MKKFIVLIMVLAMQSAVLAADRIKEGGSENRADSLARRVPNASSLMLQMGERYSNIYWAAMQEKWEFARYQQVKMEEVIKNYIITQPRLAATADKFIKNAFSQFPQAFQQKNWTEFNKAFTHMRMACIECHEQNQLAFLTLAPKPVKGTNPVLY